MRRSMIREVRFECFGNWRSWCEKQSGQMDAFSWFVGAYALFGLLRSRRGKPVEIYSGKYRIRKRIAL